MWEKVEINIQNIKRETERAVLIQLPNKSHYKGYTFWFPKKLVRGGSHGYAATISFNETFTFKIHKGDYEEEIGPEEIREAFKGTNENIHDYKEAFLNVVEPTKIDKEVKVLEEFKNEQPAK